MHAAWRRAVHGRPCALLLAALAALAAAPAAGGPMAWEGALRFEPLFLAPVELRGTGLATLDGDAGGVRLTRLRLAGGITGVASASVTPVRHDGTVAVQLDAALGSGTLEPFWPPAPFGDPQLTRAALPVGGWLRLCVFFPGCPYAYGPELSRGSAAVGVGGLLTFGGSGTLRISIDAAPWTVGTASVALPTPGGATVPVATRGWVHGPLSFTQSTARTGGELSLVTPLQVRSRAGQQFQGFGRLRIRFVPEPGRLAGLLLGALGLLLLGRARIRP